LLSSCKNLKIKVCVINYQANLCEMGIFRSETPTHTIMKKFIVLYHTPPEAQEQTAAPSPEEMEEGMKPWMAWAEKCGDHLVDLGNPLVNGKNIDVKGNVRDSIRQVSGYSILRAEDVEQARSLLNNHPHLSWHDGCEIELHEVMPLPGSN